MTSNEQISFFDTFGYLVFHGLFSAEEMAVIDREFEDVMAARPAQPHLPSRKVRKRVGE